LRVVDPHGDAEHAEWVVGAVEDVALTPIASATVAANSARAVKVSDTFGV
jgi:hypothetical protein